MSSPSGGPNVVFLCTGNAARSVMAGAALDGLGGCTTVTAGTFVIEGQPMSWRTRQAIERAGVAVPRHASRQLTERHLDEADLVVALACEHVAYVRREHPAAAAKTATLQRLCRDLPTVDGSLADRVAALDLAAVELEPWEDVDDPAGCEVEVYEACAKEVVDLVADLHAAISGTTPQEEPRA